MNIWELLFGKRNQKILDVEQVTIQPEIHRRNNELTAHLLKAERNIRVMNKAAETVKYHLDEAISRAIINSTSINAK